MSDISFLQQQIERALEFANRVVESMTPSGALVESDVRYDVACS